MGIKAQIVDPSTGLKAEVVDEGEKNALVVATRPLKTRTNQLKFFTNPDNGSNMNIDASAGGTPEQVHNGLDDVLWTGSQIRGSTDFSDGYINHTSGGSDSVGLDGWIEGAICQFAKGSSLDLSNYVSLTVWVYVRRFWNDGDSFSVYGWDTGTNSQVGDKVFFEDYFDGNDSGVWQKMVIPLTDMGLASETIDALRMEYESHVGSEADLYVDDIQFEETGTPTEYLLEPEVGTWLYVDNLKISVANNVDTTLLNASMPNLSYDDLLGETLVTGLVYQQVQDEEVVSTVVYKDLMNVLQLPRVNIRDVGCDGTNTYLTIDVTNNEAVVLKSEDNDRLRFVISDDLSGLLHLRVSAGCREEVRS